MRCAGAMALSNRQLKDGKSAGTGLELRDETPALGVALVLMLMFMGATLPRHRCTSSTGTSLRFSPKSR